MAARRRRLRLKALARGLLPKEYRAGVVSQFRESFLLRALEMESEADLVRDAVLVKSAFAALYAGAKRESVHRFYDGLMSELRASQALRNFDVAQFSQLRYQAQTGFAHTTKEAAALAALLENVGSDETLMSHILADLEEVVLEVQSQ